MKKVVYFGTFGDRCIRHGNVERNCKGWILTPNDTTHKININDSQMLFIDPAKDSLRIRYKLYYR